MEGKPKILSIGDVQTLVFANFNTSLSAEVPDEIVWIPDGSHDITPSVGGKAQRITVTIPKGKGASIAAALQKSLDARLNDNVLPLIAFDHATIGPKAGTPKSFRYEEGKGILVSVEWSSAGRNAISGRDYSHFSPAFYVDKDNVPNGIPMQGEIGSLVNNPAFRQIPRIAASDQEDHLPNHEKTMPKQILAALNISEAAADAEGAAVSAIKAMQTENVTLKSEKTDLTTKLEAANGKLKAQADQRADDLVKAAVLANKILSKDEETQSFYRDLIAGGNAAAEKALEKLPELNGDLATPVVKSSQDKVQPAGEHKFITAAKAKVASKEAENIDAAFAIVAAENPALYGQYREEALVAVAIS